MPAAMIDIGSLVTSTPEIRGGRARVAGTGVTVQSIVGWYKVGLSPEEIGDRIGHLSLAQVHADLAYYHSNQQEIEREIAADRAKADQIEQQHAGRPTS